jgi:hypothetical protein
MIDPELDELAAMSAPHPVPATTTNRSKSQFRLRSWTKPQSPSTTRSQRSAIRSLRESCRASISLAVAAPRRRRRLPTSSCPRPKAHSRCHPGSTIWPVRTRPARRVRSEPDVAAEPPPQPAPASPLTLWRGCRSLIPPRRWFGPSNLSPRPGPCSSTVFRHRASFRIRDGTCRRTPPCAELRRWRSLPPRLRDKLAGSRRSRAVPIGLARQWHCSWFSRRSHSA